MLRLTGTGRGCGGTGGSRAIRRRDWDGPPPGSARHAGPRDPLTGMHVPGIPHHQPSLPGPLTAPRRTTEMLQRHRRTRHNVHSSAAPQALRTARSERRTAATCVRPASRTVTNCDWQVNCPRAVGPRPPVPLAGRSRIAPLGHATWSRRPRSAPKIGLSRSAPNSLPKSDTEAIGAMASVTIQTYDLQIPKSGWPDLNRRPLRPEAIPADMPWPGQSRTGASSPSPVQTL
jgi:hypothetical protein